ncbi:nuclear transport factor 2 family protein [Streptomyces bambusae]|uniref:nuclear transport factor 2 family protein n=1 Tax=Streptomyces bambusae TaxID=1550616 RepID=UPI001CFC8245|nr:nuclear transport factor 2 family protein [Streptomyces bambusae]MCB5168265.1 nuclear transport factor 2 family protein [Streptomyces bambusae]
MSAEVLALAERYLTLWNGSDDERRRALAAELFTPEGVYADPNVEAHGPAEVAAYVSSERQKFGGMVFTLGRLVGSHHNVFLFTWELGPAGAQAPVATGFDTVVVEDGRLARVFGFFG